MPDLVTIDDVRRAAERVRGTALRTPLVPYADLDGSLFLKPECLQPIGAFKLRGAQSALAALAADGGVRGVVAHSSGNHAQAVAYVARSFQVPAIIVMPETAPASKVEATRALGAEVMLVAPTGEARHRRAAALASEHGYAVIPPFDDPHVIAGQGTVGLEVAEDAPDVDAVLVPISGGGLISGIAVAVKALAPRVAVIGVEPELAADARDSLRAGRRTAWPAELTARTIADALRAEQVGVLPFEHIRRYVDDIVTVREDEIREAMRLLARRARLVAEPAGALAAAASLFRRAELRSGQRHVAVVSGGNPDPALYAEIVGAPVPYAG